MFERFTQDARATVKGAREEAMSAGDDAIEAEHLLLAIAGGAGGLRSRELGLDRDRLLEAFAEEERRSLAAVGVDLSEIEPPAATPARREPRMATSSKIALQRALGAAKRRGDRHLDAGHVLLGVLSVEHGRTARALRIAEIDVEALRARI
jgi:ATP-dependent Clp protease ATP-binding subunit ClpA